MAQRKNELHRRGRDRLRPHFLIVVVPLFVVLGILIERVNSTPLKEVTRVEPIVVGEFDTVDVHVPVAPVPKGQRLSEVKFTKMKYPRHQLPKGAITDINLHLNAFTLTELPAGHPVLEQNTTQTNLGSNPVAERIPEGMRAMTVKVDPASLVNGWAGPGSIVDIALLTSKKSMVIAEKVRVLSTERFVAPVDGAPAEGLPSTATILVDQEQALAISTGMPHGKLLFMLRNSRDDGNWEKREYEASRLERAQLAKSSFKGFISVKNGGGSYALNEDGWVAVDVAPTGSLIKAESKENSDLE
jgi:Flp pilus assembly protein CpaB